MADALASKVNYVRAVCDAELKTIGRFSFFGDIVGKAIRLVTDALNGILQQP